MPFPKQIPTPFTRSNIEGLMPKQNGVYGLYRGNVCIFVGKGDIRQRLLDHFNGDNPRITQEFPTHFVNDVTPQMDELEQRLIAELKPICNQIEF